jgi:hypothetical protein
MHFPSNRSSLIQTAAAHQSLVHFNSELWLHQHSLMTLELTVIFLGLKATFTLAFLKCIDNYFYYLNTEFAALAKI